VKFKNICSALQIEASPPPQDLAELEEGMGLSPDARAPAEEREMRPALRGEGGVRGWGMLCEGQATLLPIHLSLSLSIGLATSTISGPHASCGVPSGPRLAPVEVAGGNTGKKN
jgi:hypothetical protein